MLTNVDGYSLTINELLGNGVFQGSTDGKIGRQSSQIYQVGVQKG